MVLDLVLLGVGIALHPFRLSAFIMILSTKGGTRNGLGFILGWLACLALVTAVVVLITGGRLWCSKAPRELKPNCAQLWWPQR